MKTKKLLVACGLLFVVGLTGCAAIGTGPQNEREAFPLRNQDPRIGLIINQGSAHLNLFIYDEADRLIEQVYVAGVNRYLEMNGQNIPRYWARLLAIGQYRVEIFPFYYKTDIVAPLFGKPGRYRVDLPKQTVRLWVNNNPTTIWYGGRHWAWILYLNAGNIPETAHGLPGIKFNFQGEAWKLIFGE
ncbi:MAG: hypothetical protein Q8N28_03275 [bacterium]|nr:hypothetical protein [bacterium]